LVAFVPGALVLTALGTDFLAIAGCLADLGLVADAVDLVETGARAARGDAEVFEDMLLLRVGSVNS